MKKKNCLFLLLAFIFIFSSTFEIVFASGYDGVVIEEENNLVKNEFDWLIDGTGEGDAIVNENGMKIFGASSAGSAFATYGENKLNEYKVSMYAKLNLVEPYSLVPNEVAQNSPFNYSNLYMTFFIFGDNLIAGSASPWNSHAYLTICFENSRGTPLISYYMYESWAGNGTVWYSTGVNTTAIKWNNQKYHWYEFEVRDQVKNGRDGKMIDFIYDGEKALSYFFEDGEHVAQDGTKHQVDIINMDSYFGFWLNSGLPFGSKESRESNYVQIDKMQVISYDIYGNETKLKQGDIPEFNIDTKIYSSKASYLAGEDIEIKLADCFDYKGKDALTYEVKCNNKPIGKINNGYWLWTPDVAGNYDIDISASNATKSASNFITFRVKDDPNAVKKNTSCNSGSKAGATVIVTLMALFVIKFSCRLR